MTNDRSDKWSHPSVVNFAGTRDPISAVIDAARKVVLSAREKGWSGPPFNPIELAPHFGAKLRANSNLLDARVIVESGETIIEYNPTQPRERIRFSIAHELAHILFPDYRAEIRNRAHVNTGDDWQLETLCNIAASEFVLPIGSLPQNVGEAPIEELMRLRREFDVSAEAFLIRVVKTSESPISMFVAKPTEDAEGRRRYEIEYSIDSPTAPIQRLRGMRLPLNSEVRFCTAIGHSHATQESWPQGRLVAMEFVGIPTHPGAKFPRVAGIIRHDRSEAIATPIAYRHGNIVDAIGKGPAIFCQLVNDRAVRWGGGVAKKFAERCPEAEKEFSEKIMLISARDRLGRAIFVSLNDNDKLANIIGQEGFGKSLFPRIRYSAVQSAFRHVAQEAVNSNATVHMPRIGTGAAGGEWSIIEEIVDDELVRRGIKVIVYDLPPKRHQLKLL